MSRALALVLFLILLSISTANSASDPSNLTPQTSNPSYVCPPIDRPPTIRRKSIFISNTSDRYAEGMLESWPGAAILKLYGTPREMGYQHGALLKSEIVDAVTELEERRGMSGAAARARVQAEGSVFVSRYFYDWPDWLREEAQGIAEGAELPIEVVVWLNVMYARLAGEVEKTPEPPLIHGIFSEEVPRFIVAIYHPDGAPKYASVTRAGGVGAIGGMRASGCCLTAWTADDDRRAEFKIDGKRIKSRSQTSARAKLSQGLCGGKKEEVRSECSLDSFALGGEFDIRLLAGKGIICLHEPGVEPLAVDIISETLSEECQACSSD